MRLMELDASEKTRKNASWSPESRSNFRDQWKRNVEILRDGARCITRRSACVKPHTCCTDDTLGCHCQNVRKYCTTISAAMSISAAFCRKPKKNPGT
ncbi:hypothetical protein PMG11_02438 [Penicillium brasilianum]|uniref:Uncharacterized protein n=1 Tax=Penicillium brasilianum TaxID=104259 RepID=A0A0F7TL96_PENBI|nr:hypothetical protein PMG11_02438 [Penicillium brasilianum]